MTNRVCVECLDSGRFKWYDLDSVPEFDSDYEYEIVDAEGVARELLLMASVSQIAEIAEAVDRYEYLCAYAEVVGWTYALNDLDTIGQESEDRLVGVYDSWEDFAYEIVQDGCMGEVNEALECYIDYEKLGHDLSFDYMSTEIEDGFVIWHNS